MDDRVSRLFTKADIHAFDPIYCSADARLFHVPGFEGPLAWWQDLKERTGGRPTRKDIQFSSLSGMHDDLILSKIADDRKDMEIRIAGKNANEVFHGRSSKGTSFRSLVHTTDENQEAHLSRIADEYCIALNIGIVRLASGEDRKVTVLDFPLVPSETGACSYIMSFYLSKPVRRFWSHVA